MYSNYNLKGNKLTKRFFKMDGFASNNSRGHPQFYILIFPTSIRSLAAGKIVGPRQEEIGVAKIRRHQALRGCLASASVKGKRSGGSVLFRGCSPCSV